MKQKRKPENYEKSISESKVAPLPVLQDERDPSDEAGSFGSLPVVGSGTLDRLVDTAKDYARLATAENTNAAYKTDWAHFGSWCRRRGAEPLPPSPELIGLYIAECASPTPPAKPLTVATIQRRLSGLAWHYQQRGFSLDRKDRHIACAFRAHPPGDSDLIRPPVPI